MADRAVARRSIMDKAIGLVCRAASAKQWAQWLRVPLEHAAAAGDLDLVNDLLAAGADGRAGWKGCLDRSLLYAAVQGGNDKVVSALLNAGSKPDVNVCCGERKWSPLHYAARHGHFSIAKMLLLAGADAKILDGSGTSSLFFAMLGGNVQLVCHLLMSGAPVNLKIRHWDPLLHMAIHFSRPEMVTPLLLGGAEVDGRDEEGQSPLLVAAKRGYLTAVRALLTAGADIGLKDNCGSSALEWAANGGRVDVIKELLQHGADAQSGNSNGWTPLHAAVAANQASAVDALADAGVDVDARGGEFFVHRVIYYIPLHLAVERRAVDALLALLRHRANPNAKDDEGRTPLMVASQCVEVDMVGILLRWGADETVVDDAGQSAIGTIGSRLSLEERYQKYAGVCRVRKLLENAPSDRAWRRRGLLILCRARAEKRGLASSSVQTASGSVEHTSGSRTVKSAKRRHGVENNGKDDVNGGTSGLDKAVASTVEAMVVGLEQDSLFRTILSFL